MCLLVYQIQEIHLHENCALIRLRKHTITNYILSTQIPQCVNIKTIIIYHG